MRVYLSEKEKGNWESVRESVLEEGWLRVRGEGKIVFGWESIWKRKCVRKKMHEKESVWDRKCVR